VRASLHDRLSKNIGRHVLRDVLRVAALVASDAALLLGLRAVIHGLRNGWLGSAVSARALDAFPWGFLDGPRFGAALILSLLLVGAYRSGDARRDAARLARASALAALLSLYGSFWVGDFFPTLGRLASVTLVFSLGLMVSRAAVDAVVWRLRPYVGVSRTLVVAHTDAAWRELAGTLKRAGEFVAVGNVTLDAYAGQGIHPRLRGLGRAIETFGAETVLLWGNLTNEEFAYVVDVSLAHGCRLLAGARTSVGEVEPRGVWIGGRQLVELTPPTLRGWQLGLKRVMDLVGSALGLVVLAPVFAVVAALVKLDSRGPVIFSQERIGYAGRVFRIHKFRTMRDGADAEKAELAHLNHSGDHRLFKIPDDPRVTRLGQFLRRWSLDELPQLWNVFTGDMSLVGPRPFFEADLQDYLDHHYARLGAKPGITGLWQVNGRSSMVDFEEVVRLDRKYVYRWSIWLDLKILLLTAPAVLRRRGAC
jgi:exopolysaccharide biosynthesis polyprenyl glycosylphosphotransferase